MAKKSKNGVSKPAAAPSAKPTKARTPATKPAAVKAAKRPAAAAAKPKASTTVTAKSIPLESAVAAPATKPQSYASFEDAKSAAIDALLETIESAERRLCQAKRAASFAELEQLANGRAV
jgi:hypothetical protein